MALRITAACYTQIGGRVLYDILSNTRAAVPKIKNQSWIRLKIIEANLI